MLLAGGAAQRLEVAMVKVQGKQVARPVAEVAQGRLTATLTDPDYREVGDMAMLSAIVYSGVKATGNRPDYKQDTAKYAVERRELKRKQWKVFPFTHPLVAPAGQRKMEGLTYDVWVRELPGQAPLAVLVFRGTNFQELNDWLANGRPLTNTPGRWDQYEQVRALTPVLVARLDAAYGGKERIFAAGHSLGGGLAQHAGYTCRDVEKVFAFNSSPLTGFYDVKKQERIGLGQGRRAFMVNESAEVLTLPRLLPELLRDIAKKEDVVTVRYNFSAKPDALRLVRQHDMQRLVVGLTGKR
jgi:hypothetical protein